MASFDGMAVTSSGVTRFDGTVFENPPGFSGAIFDCAVVDNAETELPRGANFCGTIFAGWTNLLERFPEPLTDEQTRTTTSASPPELPVAGEGEPINHNLREALIHRMKTQASEGPSEADKLS